MRRQVHRPQTATSEPRLNRLMKNRECRGAKPHCQEYEGVPQIQNSSLSSLERAPESLPWAKPVVSLSNHPTGWSKEFFSATSERVTQE